MTFRDGSIRHAAFQVNVDQTQLVYEIGGRKTFDVCGAKQVSVVGLEEKRAITVVVAISGAGDLLPFQVIYTGKSNLSLPVPSTTGYTEAMKLGFKLCPSMTANYWSTLELMQEWVTTILVPYFKKKIVEHGITSSQECVLQLDCWSVHRSDDSLKWMKTNFPWITLIFVPGGCTPLFQPCDTAMQKTLKHSVRKSQSEDVIEETLTQLEEAVSPTLVRLDRSIPTLRNRTVRWLVEAYHACDDVDLIKRVCLVYIVLSFVFIGTNLKFCL